MKRLKLILVSGFSLATLIGFQNCGTNKSGISFDLSSDEALDVHTALYSEKNSVHTSASNNERSLIDSGTFHFAPGELTIQSGQRIGSDHCFLTMQTDGNLVLYVDYKPVWHTATNRPNSQGTAVYQTDGNFVIYEIGGAVWSLRSNRSVGLTISDEAPYVIPRYHTDSDIQVIENRLVAEKMKLDKSYGDHWAIELAKTRTGLWDDLQYSVKSSQSFEHMNRLKLMTVYYRNWNPYQEAKLVRAGKSRPTKAEFAALINQGLKAWISKNPESDNWFANQIGQQLHLIPVLLLMKNELEPTTLEKAIKLLYKTVPKSPDGKEHDAQNLLWFLEQRLIRALLENNPEDILKATQLMESELQVNSTNGPAFAKNGQWRLGKGIQSDYSYHMHGPQLYNAGYGVGTLEVSLYMKAQQGTKFAFSSDSIEALAQFAVNGTGYMIRGKMFDPSAMGRNISRLGSMGNASKIIPSINYLADISPKNADALRSLVAHINGAPDSASFLGHKHFWNSDFTVHQRKGYYTSVKMMSSRTTGTESIGDENLLGYWLPYGANFIVQRGDEYTSLPPVWEWDRLPGVTSPNFVPKANPEKTITQEKSFVGGVSNHGVGVSAMSFVTPQTSGIELSAQKAWFFFDREYVALGAGISSASSHEIRTTLNQTILASDEQVLVDGNQVMSSRGVSGSKWILHDGIGYIFPDYTNAELILKNQPGSWSRINTSNDSSRYTGRREAKVFTLSINHGQKPRNKDYAYIIVPNTNSSEIRTYAQKPDVEILFNDVNLQAVQNRKLGITQAVFYVKGQLRLFDGTLLSVENPCFVIVKNLGDSAYEVTVSSPDEYLVTVKMNKGSNNLTMKYRLREGEGSGSSYAKRISL